MTLSISPDVVWMDADDEIRLYDAASAGFRTLNTTAAAVWRAVAAGEDAEQMAARFAEDFHAGDDAQRRMITHDVRTFLAGLRSQGLVVDSRHPC